jgi:hypothetical protein
MFTVDPLGSRWIRPFLATMGSSDSRAVFSTLPGSLRFLDLSFPARRLQSPRGAHRLRANVSSPMVSGFSIFGSLATPTLCNEAESSSLALRLTSSPLRASPWGLLLSVPVRLHAGHSVCTLFTFQTNREVRLRLTHQKTQKLTKIFSDFSELPLDLFCDFSCFLWPKESSSASLPGPEFKFPNTPGLTKTAEMLLIKSNDRKGHIMRRLNYTFYNAHRDSRRRWIV